MTKKERTFLFIVVATLFNILVTIILTLLFIVLYSVTLGRIAPGLGAGLGLALSFVLGIIGSNFVYKWALMALGKKVDLEAKFGAPSYRKKR